MMIQPNFSLLRSWFSCVFLWSQVLALSAQTQGLPPADLAGARRTFAHPPRQFASAPLWVWNDLLTEDQIRDTMHDLASQSVKQLFVHPRPGLMTPYLSPDWFRLWKVALREAERLDMNVWIYDENSYPSGFAGGNVPKLMPMARGRGLALREANTLVLTNSDVLAAYRLTQDACENVTSQLRSGANFP
jgi:hypothetical protein